MASTSKLNEFLEAVGIEESNLKKYDLKLAGGLGVLTDPRSNKKMIGYIVDSGKPIKTKTVFWVKDGVAYICKEDKPRRTSDMDKNDHYSTVEKALEAIENSAQAGILRYYYED